MSTVRLPLPLSLRVPLTALLCAAALGGCSLIGPKRGDEVVQYAPDPRVAADASWPTVPWQLSVTTPVAARAIDSLRIAVRPNPAELQVYKGASWAKRPTDMVEDALLRTLEDSGKIPAVARQGSGISADYKLVLDLRRFEADYAGAAVPAATIELNAKLLHAQDQQVVAARTFQHAQPAASTAVPDVVAAFDRALAQSTRELAGWVLTAGDAHERSGKH